MVRLYIQLVVFAFLLALCTPEVLGQSHNYWSRSFNEESSLLGGAVVGGGAGPAAIYYNPSSISEITESKFSLHASLFQFDFVNVKNGLGDGIDLSDIGISIAPRFLSYMIKPKKHPEWSVEIAFMNSENYELDFTTGVDFKEDILQNLPGEERYFAYFQYSNQYRDDWVGGGLSWKINPRLYIGASLFASIVSLKHRVALDIECFPVSDSIVVDGEVVPFYSANHQAVEYVKYNDYRLIGKLGMMYSNENISFGLALTTPAWSVFADGKKIMHKEKESNITYPGTGEPLPDYVLVDYQEKKNVSIQTKQPISLAAGFNYIFGERNGTVYSTVEYFGAVDPYRMVEANENPDMAAGSVFEDFQFNEWLTFVGGADPVLNVAVGYRTNLKENLMLLAGFRTDFNYRKNLTYDPFGESKIIRGLDVDLYHLTGGLTLNILGQDLLAGIQYSVGRRRGQQQFVNLTDPVEYNFEENSALVGTRQNTMDTLLNSLSIYFGATFNFGGDSGKNKNQEN